MEAQLLHRKFHARPAAHQGQQWCLETSCEKNPIQDQLNIISSTRLSNAELEIFDLSGRQVMFKDLGQTPERISVGINLNSGVYIVELRSDIGKFVTKIIVE